MPSEVHGSESDRSYTKDKLHKKYSFTNYAVPTGNLDTNNKEKIIHLFKELKKEGKTIICVTHDEKMAKSADRIIDLKKERGSEK